MTTESMLKRAIAAHKGGRLTEAEVGYHRVLRERPNDPDVLNFLGMLRFHQGNPEAAVRELRQSIDLNPDNPHARINLGNVLLAGKDDAGAHEQFLKATELAPDLAGAWYNLGVCLRRLQRPDDAATALYKALKLQKGHSQAHETLSMLLYRQGRFAEAAQIYRDWLEHDPGSAIARHMLAAMSGEGTPLRGSDEYVATLFDRFADSFDENLAEIGYRAPQLLGDRLQANVAPGATLDILDAGCGTGLAAPLLKPHARRLVGVDLSAGMLAKARQRSLYDDLETGELCAFMQAHPQEFDVVVSADTLCYFGALEEPVAAARRALKPGALLLFSLEAWDSPDPSASFHLQPHGRYRHTAQYVRRVLETEGFTIERLDCEVLRRERGADVMGHVVTASLPKPVAG
jgi:predicted TPR repeat methyltransferase